MRSNNNHIWGTMQNRSPFFCALFHRGGLHFF
nr:MAG TPA: Putative pertussis-like toxin subunit, Cytolethal, bacterial toxin, sugar, TOXIN [Caudoviricetes sp.]